MRALLKYFMLLFAVDEGCTYLPEESWSSENATIIETDDYIHVGPDPDSEITQEGILFVPGGLVDPHAYIKTFEPFVEENNMNVVILKVRGNLAIQNIKQVHRVAKEFSDTDWFLAGHSLGGTVGAMSVECNPEDYLGLILMGSYASVDISDWDRFVYVTRGSEDKLATIEDISKNYKNIPPPLLTASTESAQDFRNIGFSYYDEIEGGNHAQFGHYGHQKGDGEPVLTSAEQKEQFHRRLISFLNNTGYDL